MAHLGNYYAEKILGAADLTVFDKIGDERQRASAVEHLQQAVSHWRKYAAIYSPALLTKVEEDVAIAKDRKWAD